MSVAKFAAGMVAVIALIACGTSNVANDAQVTVSGQLLSPNGSPAAGLTVGLIQEPDGISALIEFTATVTTLGMLCLTQTVAICKGARKATTDAQGRYTFTMNGKDSKNILGNPARFALSAQLSSGARAQTRFEISSTTIAVPTTTFWEPERFSATPGPQWITYSFSEFKSKPASSGYQISLTRDEEAIWNQAATPEGRIDARAAANTTGNLRAIASVKLDDFTTTHHSPPIAFQGVAGQPISRGANCAQADPCPLTDDRYSSGTSSQTCPSASPSPSPSPCGGIEIDLGRPRSISAVFLHGLGISPDATVETSVDGTQWTKRATQRPAAFLAMTWQSPVQARYVWLHAARDGTVFTLTELAVW